MSYAMLLPLRGLGAGFSTSASANVALDVKSGASVSKTVEDAAKAADVQLPDCSDAAVTGNSYLDSTFVKCCQDIKKMSGMSLKQKAEGIGQCAARGAATGACMAAGVVSFGVTTALAPLCGTVGAAVYDRVIGYDTKQWVAAGVGAAVCSAVSAGIAGPICAFAAAELVGWIADELGPLFDSIFSPNAARDRELAARKAFHSLVATNEKTMREADSSVRDLWSNSIGSIKEAYLGSLALLPSSYRAKAQQALGFAPLYDGIAGALTAAGAPRTPLTWPVDGAGATVADRLRAQRQRAGYGCEGTAAGCIKDGYSEICPFSFSDLYMTAYYSEGIDKLTGNTRDRHMAFEKYALSLMQNMASAILARMQQAIAVVATKVATVMAGFKQQALLEAAKAKDDAKLVATAVSAAKAAERAALEAKSWSGSTREKAIAQAQRKYEIVVRASGLLTYAASSAIPPSATSRSKMADAVKRASAAVKLAKTNAQTAQLTLGAGVALGVTGIGYLLLRRT